VLPFGIRLALHIFLHDPVAGVHCYSSRSRWRTSVTYKR
jgi:hypothetical protein